MDDPNAQATGGGDSGSAMPFLMEFLKANPDIAQEMHTRMNAVINSQKLGAMKTADSPAPVQSGGEVTQLPNAGGTGETAAAAPYALGQQTAPNVASIGDQTLKDWYTRTQGRQG